MQWTSEQIDQIKSAVAEGRRRVSVRMTDVQRQLWRQEVATEDAGHAETVARVSRIRAAAMRPGVFGDLRRAIALARIPDTELASQVGVDVQLLDRFREGEAELPGAAIERLAAVLGLRLMHEIPRPAGA
jgi:ribosome-binding protein aMBF1 (putative translation factor)